MHRDILFVLLLALVSTACSDDSIEYAKYNDNEKVDSHLIPLDKAMASLDSFLKSEGHTKSPQRVVSSISTISSSSLHTKTADFDACESLAYLVNFENNNGFALLAADNRLDEVIVVTESGSLSQDQLLKAMARVQSKHSSTKVLQPTLSEIDDLEFYNEDYDDYYIGDYDYTEGSNQQYICSTFISNLCAEYLCGGPIIGPPGDDPEDPPFPPLYDDVQIVSNTVFNNAVLPMLGQLSSWSQAKSPYYDKLTYFWGKANVGCVNIAIGKLMTYLEYPTAFIADGVTIDWSSVKVPVSHADSVMVSSLCRRLYEDNGSIPFLSLGTFVLPALAKNNLVSYGFSNVVYQSYDSSSVCTALLNGCPVFVRALNNEWMPDIIHSHAWNIDGYKEYITTTTYYYYLHGHVVNTNTMTSTKKMMHCAWGWGGSYDGYFLSGIFNLADASAEFDDPDDEGGMTLAYTYGVKTITYSHP